MPRWNERFFASTRGQIVALLRRTSRTVDELARALNLTDNAVRAHLATLERDGLVEQRGSRRGAGKPAYAYRLTAEADSLFPKAYAEVLRRVLGQMAARHGRGEVEAILRAVGQELARSLGAPAPGVSLEQRLEAVAGVLGELGGLAEARRVDGRYILEGFGCPLQAIVSEHPEACQLALALVQELLGRPDVVECCAREPEPRCRFELAAG